MRIKRVVINRFGKLSGESISFDDGLNVVYGPNESGKSTLHGFIYAMLFGMERGRGRASKTDDYTRFEPRESPLEYSGSIEFEENGTNYLLSRDFAAGRRKDMLVNTDLQENIPVYELNSILEGVSGNLYSNIESVAQDAVIDSALLSGALTDRYSVLDSDSEGSGVISKTLSSLAAQRKQLESGRRKAQKERDEKASNLRSKIDYVDDEIRELRNRLAAAALSTETIKRPQPQEIYDDEEDELYDEDEKSGAFKVLFVIGALLLIGAASYAALTTLLLSQDIMKTILWSGIIGLSGVICLIISSIMKTSSDIEEDEEDDDSESETGDRRNTQTDDTAVFLNYLRDTLRQKETEKIKLAGQYEIASKNDGSLDVLDTKIEGLAIAEETVRTIAEKSRLKYEKIFREKAARIFEYLSADEDRALVFEDGLEPGLLKDNIYIPFWQCSRGTRDVIDFSIRLAASDILSDDDRMPLLLDDALAPCDDDRVKRILLFLKNTKRQVILFTCQMREIAALNEMGVSYTAVSWSGTASKSTA